MTTRLQRADPRAQLKRQRSDMDELKGNQEMGGSVTRYYLNSTSGSISVNSNTILNLLVTFTSDSARIPLNDINYRVYASPPPDDELSLGDPLSPNFFFARRGVNVDYPNVTQWELEVRNFTVSRIDCYATFTVQATSPGTVTVEVA